MTFATYVENKSFFDSEFPVLVIYDNKETSLSLRDFLNAELSCNVDIANSFQEAKKTLESRIKYSFIVIDLDIIYDNLDEMKSLVKALKIPFCVISAIFGEEARDLVYNLGALDYFTRDGTAWLNEVSSLIRRINRNSKLKTLLVEDNKIQRMFFHTQLKRLNFKVIEAADGEMALHKLKEHPDVSLVLTDYKMPILDGVQLSAKIREIYPKDEIAILGISAFDEPRIVAKFIKAGANDCIRKNVSNEEFLWKVNQSLEMLELTKEHKNNAINDFLTGLHNRRFFFTEGIKIYESHKHNNISIAVIDIDHFKKINDTYGHAVGDKVLVFMSEMLKAYFKRQLVARVGGEEFAILFEMSKEDAFILLENFRIELERSLYPIDISRGEVIKITMSGGIMDGKVDSFDQLFKIADFNLYKAKNIGRNQIIIDNYNPDEIIPRT